MEINRYIAIIAAVILIAVSGLASADVLPKPVPENQLFTTTSIIESVGVVVESTSVVWMVGDAGLEKLADPYYTVNGNIASGSIAYATYSDSIVTNGGQISEVKSFSMDTHAKTAGLYNIETTKVLTYTSQNGSHLMGAESYVLDVVGNWRKGLDDVVCVFAQKKDTIISAFCTRVSATAKLNQITTAQIETQGGLTAISTKASTPAALFYEISAVPDANSASGYADGIFSTIFTVSVMEGRSDGRVLNSGEWKCINPDPNTGECLANPAPTNPGGNNPGGNNPGGNNPGGNSPGGNSPGGIIPTDNDAMGVGPGNGQDTHTGRVCDDPADCDDIAEIQPTNQQVCDDPADCDDIAEIHPTNQRVCDNPADCDDIVERATTNYGVQGELDPTKMYYFDVADNPTPYLEFYDQLASTLTYIDTATVVGGVSIFNKAFNYQSGVGCTNC